MASAATGPAPPIARRTEGPAVRAGSSAAAADSDLELLVGRLPRAGPPVHQVWLPPLAEAIPLDGLLRAVEPGWLRVPVGVVDRPLEQAQEPLVLDLSGPAGHLAVVGAPRAGKSTLLTTLLAALAATHRPDEVQVYAIDLGGGLLHRLAGLPHVGAVCGPREPERVHRLVRELRSLVVERERRFRDLGVDSMASWHELRRGGLDLGGYGEVFLLVDNWGALVRELPDLEAELAELAAVGLHYGLHLVLAANRWAELRPALRDNLGGRLELGLNDPLESELGRAAAAAVAGRPGRGLTRSGHQFQAARPGPTEAVLERARASPDGAVAPPLRLLPVLVGEAALPPPGPGQPAGVPFAVEEHRLDLVRVDLFQGPPHLLVLGDAECGKSSLLRLLAHGLAARHPPDEVALLVIDLRRALADLAVLPHVAGYACTPTAVVQAVEALRHRLTDRLATSFNPEGPEDPAVPRLRPPGEGVPSRLPSGQVVPSRLPPREGSPPSLPVRVGSPPVLPVGDGSPPVLRGRGVVPPLLTESLPAVEPMVRGPRYVVLVDDYDLLPTASGSPLLPLLDLLGQGRTLGLHLVLARGVAGSARAAFELVLQRVRELGGPGLIMRGDPGEGPLLGGQKAAADLPAGRGFLIRPRQPPTLVQVAYSPPPDPGGGQAVPAANPYRGRPAGWGSEG